MKYIDFKKEPTALALVKRRLAEVRLVPDSSQFGEWRTCIRNKHLVYMGVGHKKGSPNYYDLAIYPDAVYVMDDSGTREEFALWPVSA